MNEELKVIISAEIKKLQDGVKKAKKAVLDFAKDAKKKIDDFGEAFADVGDKAKKGLAVVGGTIAGTATALLSLSSSTAEYRTAQAQLASAFETAGGSAETAKQVYNDLYRVLGDTGQATEASQQLANITTNQQHLSEWTTICQGVFAKMGESIPVESLAEGASEAIRTGTATAGLTDALVWAGVAEDEFNAKLQACNTEAEREALIRETLNGLYSESATAYETNNASMLAYNEAQAKMSSAMASIGEALQPVMTALISLGADVLTVITPYIQEFIANYLPSIQDALAGVGEKIGLVSDNWELVSTIGTIILGIVATLSTLSIAISAVSTVLTIATSPITLVVLGITALITAIVLCVKHWDVIKAKIAEVAENIKAKVSEMKEKVVSFFSDLGENIKNKVAELKENAVNKFNEMKDNASAKILALRTNISSYITGIVSDFRTKFNSAKTTVVNIFENIKSGITEKIESLKEKVSSIIEAIKGFFSFTAETPKIKLPKFGITPEGWKLKDLLEGSIPKLSIKWNAMGGVFDTPTLFAYGHGSLGGLGENGAEAVVPLEKNLGWLDKLATMLQERMGGNRPIVLQVDGKTFAETSIASINQHTRQTGKLGINLI